MSEEDVCWAIKRVDADGKETWLGWAAAQTAWRGRLTWSRRDRAVEVLRDYRRQPRQERYVLERYVLVRIKRVKRTVIRARLCGFFTEVDGALVPVQPSDTIAVAAEDLKRGPITIDLSTGLARNSRRD